MNIRLVGAALLLLSTLSLSPIAEAQLEGVDDLSCFCQVTNPVIFNLANSKNCGLNAECDLLCRGQVTSGSYTELCYGCAAIRGN